MGGGGALVQACAARPGDGHAGARCHASLQRKESESGGSPPISRVLSRSLAATGQSFLWATHCCAALAAYPGALRAASTPPYLALPRMGFSVPVLSPVLRWALTRRRLRIAPHLACARSGTISTLPDPLRAIGGVFSVPLSVASRRPAVSRHPALRGPDFPPHANACSDCLADFRRPLYGVMQQRSSVQIVSLICQAFSLARGGR